MSSGRRRVFLFSLFICLSLSCFILTHLPNIMKGHFSNQLFTSKSSSQVGVQSVTNKTKVILLWTPFFGVPDYIKQLDRTSCPIKSCIFTSNRDLYPSADAVIFHIRDVNVNDLPDESKRRPSQMWIMLLHESPEFTPKNVIKALDGKINWTITHRFDSDLSLTPIASVINFDETPLVKNLSHLEPVISNKKRMVAWFVSHCDTPSQRESYVNELQQYIPVDIFGTCGPFRCVPKMSSKCYNDTANNYYFYLSFENSLCKDYVTEKLFNLLEYPIVPIAMTSADLSIVAPPASVISVYDFNGPSDLATYLIHLAKNKDEYMKFFQWKTKYRVKGLSHYSCRLCQMLQSNAHSFTSKVYKDLYNWWFTQANCRSMWDERK